MPWQYPGMPESVPLETRMPSHGPSSLELLTQRTGADAETDPKVEKAWKALQKGKCSSFGQIYDPAYFLCELISIVRILA